LPSSHPPRNPLAPLPAPPHIALSVERDRTATASASGGFLNLQRLDLVAEYPGGDKSAPFPYDMVTRAAIDAAIIAAHFVKDGTRHVYLRSAVRPPVALRAIPPRLDGGLWELPAGLIEPGEEPVAAAARELEEELGFRVPTAAFSLLGPWTLPTPAVIAECHVFFHVEVDPDARAGEPTLDGSALERGGAILSMPLHDAIEHCRRGAVRDAKTELGLRRLSELLPWSGIPQPSR
jgi:ADP-ribose pyrophosphatase